MRQYAGLNERLIVVRPFATKILDNFPVARLHAKPARLGIRVHAYGRGGDIFLPLNEQLNLACPERERRSNIDNLVDDDLEFRLLVNEACCDTDAKRPQPGFADEAEQFTLLRKAKLDADFRIRNDLLILINGFGILDARNGHFKLKGAVAPTKPKILSRVRVIRRIEIDVAKHLFTLEYRTRQETRRFLLREAKITLDFEHIGKGYTGHVRRTTK